MSNDISSSAKVATKFKELAAALGQDIEDVQVKVQEDFGTKTLDGKAIKEAMEEDATKGSDDTEGDDQSTTEDTTEGGDDDEDTIGDGEVQCQCGAIFDSKQSLYGHSSHCDEYESSTEGGDEEEDTIEDGDEPQHPEDAEDPSQENYVFHFGTCSEEDCSYGANGEEAEFCASHQGSSSSSKKNESSSKKTDVSYDDLTKGQKAAVNNLLEEKADDDSFGVEEAIQMV